jgi:outer membrane protein assembly factor BamB
MGKRLLWNYTLNGSVSKIVFGPSGEVAVLAEYVYLFDKGGRFLSKASGSDVAISSGGEVFLSMCKAEDRRRLERSKDCFSYTFDYSERYNNSVSDGEPFCFPTDVLTPSLTVAGVGDKIDISSNDRYIVGANNERINVFLLNGSLLYDTCIRNLAPDSYFIEHSIYENRLAAVRMTSDAGKVIVWLTNAQDWSIIIRFYNQFGLTSKEFKLDGFLSDSAASDDGGFFLAAVYGNAHVQSNNLYFYGGDKLAWKFPIESGVRCAAMTPDGSRVVAGGFDHVVYFLNSSGSLLWNFSVPWDVSDVDVTDDGKYIVVGSKDQNVYLLDSEGKLVWKFKADYRIESVKMSYDGMYIAASTEEIVEGVRLKTWGGADLQDAESKGHIFYVLSGPAGT